nr:NlpC/P60 family protein [Corynebacterium sp. TAE3-ERU12]
MVTATEKLEVKQTEYRQVLAERRGADAALEAARTVVQELNRAREAYENSEERKRAEKALAEAAQRAADEARARIKAEIEDEENQARVRDAAKGIAALGARAAAEAIRAAQERADENNGADNGSNEPTPLPIPDVPSTEPTPEPSQPSEEPTPDTDASTDNGTDNGTGTGDANTGTADAIAEAADAVEDVVDEVQEKAEEDSNSEAGASDSGTSDSGTTGSGSTVETAPSGAEGTASSASSRAAKIETVISRAKAYLGTPYAWGGGNANGPTRGIRDGGVADAHGDYNKVGFDCSGLTLYAYAGVGISLPHYTGYQYQRGTHYPKSQMQRGDLLFWGPNGHGHVAIYLGDGTMIEAPQSGDVVKISPVRYNSMTPNVVRLL